MKQKILLTIVAGALTLAVNVRAEQMGTGHYISGQFTDFSSFPPSAPGWVVANYFMDYENGNFGAELPLGRGPVSGVGGASINIQAEVPILIYAYPFSFHDITFSSGVGIPFVWVSVDAKATFDINGNPIAGGSRSQSVRGLGDMEIMPIMACWTNGDFKVGGIFNIWAPTGEYQTDRVANQGLGYWTFEPMLAFSWISSKIGTEFSCYTAVDFNTENTDANYQSGDIFHVDATLSQHLPLFGGLAGAGVSAFYLKQITGDSGSGARLGSFMVKSYGIGPTVSYAHHIGKSTFVFSGSWLPQTYSDNTTKGNYWWVKIGMAF